jgi:hypothetical protein
VITSVAPWRVAKARVYGLSNAVTIAGTCREAGVPFYVACALFEKETMGKNIYGHDKGGALSGFPGEVNKDNYEVFEWLVSQGMKSNGVGPSQITSGSLLTQMKTEHLDPWNVWDNMLFGLRFLKKWKVKYRTWHNAGRLYNGKESYAIDLDIKIEEWRMRLSER